MSSLAILTAPVFEISCGKQTDKQARTRPPDYGRRGQRLYDVMSTLFSDWLERYNKSTTSRTQAPPVRFVVDLLEAFDLSTTNPQQIE